MANIQQGFVAAKDKHTNCVVVCTVFLGPLYSDLFELNIWLMAKRVQIGLRKERSCLFEL